MDESEVTGGPDEEGRIPRDDLFVVLKNDRRRATIRLLAEREEPVSLSDVATHVADSEAETGSGGSYRSTYVSLQQSHVPLLEEYGVVRYDRESKTLRKGPQLGPVVDYLSETGTGTGRSRVPAPELAVTVGGLAVLLLERVGLLSIGESAVVGVAALALLTVGALTVARTLGWLDGRGR
jgi:DNA-binding transcriptional ArsR family regulator